MIDHKEPRYVATVNPIVLEVEVDRHQETRQSEDLQLWQGEEEH